MKLVREHINEKFTEEGDPIHDLGIGGIKTIMQELDIEETKKKMFSYYNVYTHVLTACLKQNRPDLIQLLYDTEKDVKDKISRHVYGVIHDAIYLKRKECLKVLLDNGIADNIGSEDYIRNFEYMITLEYKRLIEPYIRDVKISVNEKFTEDSDPIYDMGIGAKVVLKNSLKKTFELGERDVQKLYIFNPNQNKYHHLSTSSVREIMISGNILIIGIYSNIYYDKNKKVIDKKEYVKKLLEESGLYVFIKRFTKLRNFPIPTKGYNAYEIRYLIKPEYRKYFINKTFHGEQDIK